MRIVTTLGTPRGWMALVLLVTVSGSWTVTAAGGDRPRWKAQDLERPRPPVVTPGGPALPVAPPADAVVLFDGSDLKNWCTEEGKPSSWSVRDGAMVCPGKGEDIYTRRAFGDVQLHVEWCAPAPARGAGQGRGNSGVFLMGLYEVQVLDSHGNATYPDGQAAAVYGQYPPLVNASRPPGAWQAFDIVFRRPRFRPDGTLAEPARITLFHNGVLVQDHVRVLGPTSWLQHLPYRPHPEKLPLCLQDHGNPVRYRNIWLRELRESDPPGPPPKPPAPAIFLAPEVLARYTGTFKTAPDARSAYVVHSDGRGLYFVFGDRNTRVDLEAESPRRFAMRWTAGWVDFDLGEDGRASAMTIHVGKVVFTVKRIGA